MIKESKWAKGQDRLLFFTPLQSQTSSEQQEKGKEQGQNGKRVKMGQGSYWASVIYPSERVKMGQRSLWAAVVYPLTE